MANVRCPGCGQVLEHDRGYLPLHMTDLQRGQLVTGSKVCDYSNKKLVTDKAEVEYNNECADCGMTTTVTLTEDYPGAFKEGIKPFMDMNCIGCSTEHDGHYCSTEGCGVEVIERPADFYRVSDSENRYLPKLPDEEEVTKYRDFDTELDASTYIATLEDHESGRYSLDLMDAGWYDKHGDSECRAAALDWQAQLNGTGDGKHHGEFKPRFIKTVRVTDGHVIAEELEPGEVPEPEPELLVCGCCKLAREELPFTHHWDEDDNGVTGSISYCQECEDAGCDLIDCEVRAAARNTTRRAHA